MRGQGNAKPVTYQGVQYPSIIACARAYKLLPGVVAERLSRGQPLEVQRIRSFKELRGRG